MQLQAQQVISMGQKHVLCMETLLYAAVGTASHQHVLEACTVYGGSGSKSDKAASKVPALNYLVKVCKILI